MGVPVSINVLKADINVVPSQKKEKVTENTHDDLIFGRTREPDLGYGLITKRQ